MLLLIKLAFRNLLRQKRRNILLGSAIAFGMAVLLLANSFSHGITDLLLNKMMVQATGHIMVSANERRNRSLSIIRDRDEVINVIKDTIPAEEIKELRMDVSAFSRVIGKGDSLTSMIVGVVADHDFLTWPSVIDGNIYDFTNSDFAAPLIISSKHAKTLGVKAGDSVNIKCTTLYNEVQTGRFFVAAIISSENALASFSMYTRLDVMRELLGYREHEAGAVKVILKDVRRTGKVIAMADSIHSNLTPGLMGFSSENIPGTIDALVLGLRSAAFRTGNKGMPELVSGSVKDMGSKKESVFCLVHAALSAGKKIKPGDILTVTCVDRLRGTRFPLKYTVAGIFRGEAVPENTVLINEHAMYEVGYEHPPKISERDLKMIDEGAAVYPHLTRQWYLFDRSRTTKEFMKKRQIISRDDLKMSVMDVSTMYETFEFVGSLEKVLTMIAVYGVLILFFVILIGVFNTLRMTINERTREIGTARAIGMPAGDIMGLFILETVFLSFIASIVGILAALLAVAVFGNITIHSTGMLSMFLYERHLHFIVRPGFVLGYVISIIMISAVTAYIPARKASKLSVAEALRHYE